MIYITGSIPTGREAHQTPPLFFFFFRAFTMPPPLLHWALVPILAPPSTIGGNGTFTKEGVPTTTTRKEGRKEGKKRTKTRA